MAKLQDVGANREYPLVGKVTLIGRDPRSDVVVDQPAVSQRHAMIVHTPSGFVLEDLDSLNGTFLNGQRISGRRPLLTGDRIGVFEHPLEFHDNRTPGRTIVGTVRAEDLDLQRLASQEVTGDLHLGVQPEAKLRAVLEMSRSLADALDLDRVLDTILERLFAIFPQADRGLILLRDPRSGQFTVRADMQRGEARAEPGAFSRGILEEAVQTGRAILCADAGTDQRFDKLMSVRLLDLHSVMCVPMCGDDGVCLGVIQLDTRDLCNQFRQEDLDLLVCGSLLAARAVDVGRKHQDRRELDAATRIQQSFLPQQPPSAPGLAFFDHYVPAKFIGGDYFDYIPLPGNRLAVTVGDVCGKGIPAALLMARLSAATRLRFATATEPCEAMGQLNELVGSPDRFASCLAAVIDLERRIVTLANAGHPPPVLRRGVDGRAVEIGSDIIGLPLAGFPCEYESVTLTLAPGDVLVMYTDGISEMRNPAGELYGAERVRAAIQAGPGDVKGAAESLLADVRQFAAGRLQGDDLTLVCFGATQ
ncbi:MAG TPA: SpoIIE family protein phosphatase [Planctomycetaceae bacterium]|nr:SpoIIE family protein phosphatase [Planctomycetaceae bacterium]